MREQSSAFVPARVPFPAPVRGGLGVLAVGLTRPATRAALPGLGGLGVLAVGLTRPATRAVLPASGPDTVGVGRAVPAAAALPTATQRTRGSSPGSPSGPRRGGSVPVDAAAGLARGAAECDLANSAVPGPPGGPVENRERPGSGTGRLAAVRTGAGS